MDIFIIAGPDKSRKSSTIRALTGIKNSGYFDISINGNIEKDMYVMVTSANEIDINPKDLIALLETKTCKKALIPLRSIKPRHNLPSADEYIKQLILNGNYNIKTIMDFGGLLNKSNIVTNSIYIDYTKPTNLIASEIRKIWGFD